MSDRWQAVSGESVGEGPTAVAACVAATGNTTTLLLLDIALNATEIDVSAAVQVPFVAGSPEINNAHLLTDQPESVTEHPDFEEVAQVFGPAPGTEYDDDQDNDGTNNSELYYLVGRVGNLYFKLDYGPFQWDFIGWYDEAREAAEAVAFSGDGLSVEMLL